MKHVTPDQVRNPLYEFPWWDENSNEASEARDFIRGTDSLVTCSRIVADVMFTIGHIHDPEYQEYNWRPDVFDAVY